MNRPGKIGNPAELFLRKGRFRDGRLARMSSGHYCVIRDLGLVKGGKGLRHHEVILKLSWSGLLMFVREALRSTPGDAGVVSSRGRAGLSR